MVSCGQYKMIPMAPSSMMAMPTSSKPKIGFSIDSIVGKSEHHAAAITGLSPRSECGSERPSSPMSDCSYPLELRNNNMPRQNVRHTECTVDITENRLNRIQQFMSNSDFHNRNFATKCRPESPTNHQDCNNQKLSSMCSNSPPPHHTRLTPDNVSNRKLQRTPSPPSVAHLQSNTKGPIVVPGIPAGLVRPFPVQPPNMNEMKQIPPYINAPEMIGPPNPHFLAAQFQMAAALAHGQTGQTFPPGAGLPQHHPQFGNPNMVRESYPLYPWLLSRHGRIFPHRFPGNFLLQPFRKPKRVRTAFSPSQLLKLEHAFESNHYVVGAERKTLAQALSLTETQVKVWFQNRRTKHKRMQQEEDAKGNGSNGCNSNNNNNNNNNSSNNNSQNSQGDENAESQMSCDEDEDELIDMEDCPSDEENDLVP